MKPCAGACLSRALMPLLATAFLLATLSFPTAAPPDAAPLELWVHPYVPATEIFRRFGPIKAWLEEKTGRRIDLKVSRDYADHIARVGTDEADIAYMGPIPYVQVVDHYGPKPLLATIEVSGMPYFHGVVAVLQESDIMKLEELAGKSFAFGDPNSTMSHYLPRYMLWKAGVTIDRLARFEHLKTHDDVALSVIGGYFDAGGLKEEVFEKYRDRGLRALAVSPPMPEHLFVTRGDLDPGTVALLRKALLELPGSPGAEAVLTAIKEDVSGLRPLTDSDYDIYRKILRELDLGRKTP